MAAVRHRARRFFVLTLAVYVMSFALPVFAHDFLGMHAFLYGLVYCWCFPVIGLSWFANVALGIGLAYLYGNRWPAARRCGLLGLALGLTVLPFWWKQETLQAGYYVWMSSMGMLALGATNCESLERELVITRRRCLARQRLDELAAK